MNRNVNEHKFDRLARQIANGVGVGAAVVLVVGLLVGACMGCRELVIDTGQRIVYGN